MNHVSNQGKLSFSPPTIGDIEQCGGDMQGQILKFECILLFWVRKRPQMELNRHFESHFIKSTFLKIDISISGFIRYTSYGYTSYGYTFIWGRGVVTVFTTYSNKVKN